MKIAGHESIAAARGAAKAEATSTDRAGDSLTMATTASDSDPSGSSLTLSPRSEEASRIVELARSAPDFRVDKVEQARSDLQAGRMQPDPMAIAVKMAQEMF